MQFYDRLNRLLVVLAAVSFIILYNSGLTPWMMDDAFIFARYAENWAAGKGIVYNPGEPVEGYTSFLWTALLAAASYCGIGTVAFSKAAGLSFSVATIFLVASSHRFLALATPWESSIAAVFLASFGAFAPWASSGMETSMFAFLLTLAVLFFCRALPGASEPGGESASGPATAPADGAGAKDAASRNGGAARTQSGSPEPVLRRHGAARNFPAAHASTAGALFAIASLARPEGVIAFAVCLAFAAARTYRPPGSGPGRIEMAAVTGFAAPFLAAYGAYFAWRAWYYSSMMPNTFHAKVGAGISQVARGLAYTADFAVAAAPLVFLALLLLIRLGRAPNAAEDAFVPATVAAAHAVFVTLVGGDFMYAFRFFAPLTPLICILAARGAARTGDFANGKRSPAFSGAEGERDEADGRRARAEMPPGVGAAFAAAAVFFTVAYNVIGMVSNPEFSELRASEPVSAGREIGLFLRAALPADETIAVNAAGLIPYYSRLRTIDMLGLSDRHIASLAIDGMGSRSAGHEKGDGAYVLSKRPAVIIPGNWLGEGKPVYKGDREIFASKEFAEGYSKRLVRLRNSARPLTFYLRKGLSLKAGGEL